MSAQKLLIVAAETMGDATGADATGNIRTEKK